MNRITPLETVQSCLHWAEHDGKEMVEVPIDTLRELLSQLRLLLAARSGDASHYTVRVYCEDCTGQDDLGCFEGGTMVLEETVLPWSPRVFGSASAAEAAGWEYTKNCEPWGFEVLDGTDKVVFDSGLA